MPYLASNQDVQQQEGFKTALMSAAVLFTGAALGAGYLAKSGINLGGGATGKSVAKNLYGGNKIASDALSNIKVRNASDIAEGGMTKYALGKNWLGKDRLYSKNENLLGRFKDNHLNRELRSFNKTLGDYRKGNFGNDIYGKSKLSLYQDLYDKTEAAGFGVTTKDLQKATNNIHNSKQNAAIRKAKNWSADDDVRLSNSIWGGGDYSDVTASQRIDDYFTKDIDDAILDRNAELGKKAMAEREAAEMAAYESKQYSDVLSKQRTSNAQKWNDTGSPILDTPFVNDIKNPVKSPLEGTPITEKSENLRSVFSPKQKLIPKQDLTPMNVRKPQQELDQINDGIQKNFIDGMYNQTGGKPNFATMYGSESPLSASAPSASFATGKPKANTKRGTGHGTASRVAAENNPKKIIRDNTRPGTGESVQQVINRTTNLDNQSSYLARTSDNSKWPMSQKSYEDWYGQLLNQKDSLNAAAI